MRRFLWLLWFVVAMSACMWAVQEVRSEPVEIRALAVCEKGKCVMAEADYKQLQEFVKEAKARIEHNNQIEQQVNRSMLETQGALSDLY